MAQTDRDISLAAAEAAPRLPSAAAPRLGLRWTIGDVYPRGFRALRLSVAGAFRLFENRASYAIFVNTIARERVLGCLSSLPPEVRDAVAVRDATGLLPGWLRRRFGRGLADGMGWKLAPVRAFPDRFELALDNDVILWELPSALASWLYARPPSRGLVAGDVTGCFGRFDSVAGSAPVNLGVRGLPPGLDFEAALGDVLAETRLDVVEADDEQGLQIAALRRSGEPWIISPRDVTICSPFPPHDPALGTCGAHFVGINSRLPWNYYDRPGDEVRAEHWDSLERELEARVGLAG